MAFGKPYIFIEIAYFSELFLQQQGIVFFLETTIFAQLFDNESFKRYHVFSGLLVRSLQAKERNYGLASVFSTQSNVPPGKITGVQVWNHIKASFVMIRFQKVFQKLSSAEEKLD